jgi:transcriptional regulator with XRE-family HTH domain
MAASISQRVAAEKLGVSQPLWSEWEHGTRTPGDSLQKAIEVLTGGAIPAVDWEAKGQQAA